MLEFKWKNVLMLKFGPAIIQTAQSGATDRQMHKPPTAGLLHILAFKNRNWNYNDPIDP